MTERDSRRDPLLVIDSHDTLARFRASLRRPWLPSVTRIELDSRLAGEDTERIEERLNDVYLDCGCDIGAVALALAAVGLVAWLLVTGGSLGWAAAVRSVVILFVAAVVGKIAGLVRNRFVLASLVAHIEQGSHRQRETRNS